MLNKKIFLIFFFAFLIRLIALNQSLWLDEAITANVAKNFKFLQIVSGFSLTDFHPPLYYLFMKLWTNIFGYSEVALRLSSVIFSLLTGYLVYKIASLFHGLIDGIWSAAFFLFNPLIVYYSQEARMYIMTTFFLTSALYFFILNIKDKISKTYIKNLLLISIKFSIGRISFYPKWLYWGVAGVWTGFVWYMVLIQKLKVYCYY